MTKIWLLSDLHQEFCREPSVTDNPHTRFDPAHHTPPDFDVVVLAGDTDVHLENSLQWAADRFAGVPIVMVPGNHDFFVEAASPDQFTMLEMKVRGRELADRLGVHLLMDDTMIIDGCRFAGGTLWTDFESVGRGFLRSKEHEAAGRNGMNDYRRIKRASSADLSKRKRLRPEDTIREHSASRAYLERVLDEPHDGPTVVVTHHAPHPLSLDPAHGSLNWCYASNLTNFVEEAGPDLWLHGHIHRSVDYTIGNTRICSNPHGYRFEPSERDNGFVPNLVIEVLEPAPRLKP